MKTVNMLIKPASSLCNLRCKYCFYADISDLREVKSMGIMSSETAHALIREAFAAVDADGAVSFAFQGGEPTVAGLDFFRDFAAYAAAVRPLGVGMQFSIQTNGTLLDDEWIRFLSENHFLVGISMDGYRELHDCNRVDAKGNGTYARVTGNLKKLIGAGVETNLLCVVTAQCARHPQKVYQAMKKTGIGFLQFIACLDPMEHERGKEPYSLTPELYGSFLCGLFDLWYRDWEKGQYISIRLFDDYIHLGIGLPAGTCSTSGSCGSYFVAEGDGSIYPCDFFVLDEWKMGKVQEESFPQMLQTQAAQRFYERGRTRPAQCAVCPWVRLCRGGCPRDWIMTENGPQNYYCSAFRRFFAYAQERLVYMMQCETQAMRRYRR